MHLNINYIIDDFLQKLVNLYFKILRNIMSEITVSTCTEDFAPMRKGKECTLF
jgi:hypothetical protein